MTETAVYCNDCYNAMARTDAQVKAAERAGNVPVTKQGSCADCGKTTTVVYYQV